MLVAVRRLNFVVEEGALRFDFDLWIAKVEGR